MIIVTRAEWAGRKPKTVKLLPLTAIEGLAVHYSAAESDRTASAFVPARLRSIQSYHMDSRGWADIAYNFLVSWDGTVYEGRGWNVRSAANGTNQANDHYLAVCFLGADKEDRDDVTDAGRASISWLWAEVRRRYQSANRIVPHSDFRPTQCPGNELRSWLAAGMPLAAVPLSKEVSPMFQPPHRLPPVVAELVPPGGRGVWLLSEDGSVWAYGGAGHKGAPNGQDYWGNRRAARLEGNGDGYDVVASTGERYSYP